MNTYIVTLRRRKYTLPADSWMHAYRICTAGQKGGMPRDFRVVPNRKPV